MIMWSTFNRLFFNIDGAGRIGMLLCFLSVFLNIGHKEYRRVFKSYPILLWLIWCFYVSVVWINKDIISVPNMSPVNFLFSRIFVPWYAMFLTCYEIRYNFKILLRVLLISYVILCTFGYSVVYSIDIQDRSDAILGNEFALSSLAMVFIATFSNIEGLLKKRWLIFICMLAIACILTIATRKAFAGVLIILVTWVIANNKQISPKKLLITIPIFLFIYSAVTYILGNTKIGERFNDIQDSAELFNTSDIAWLNFLGDRAYFYIEGWNLFLENPIYGIGINNFMIVDSYDLPIHSEYIVQLCECGIIGFILFVMFYASLMTYNKSMRLNTQYKIMFLGFMLSVIFINFTSWTYQFANYFFCFGIIVGYKNINKKEVVQVKSSVANKGLSNRKKVYIRYKKK